MRWAFLTVPYGALKNVLRWPINVEPLLRPPRKYDQLNITTRMLWPIGGHNNEDPLVSFQTQVYIEIGDINDNDPVFDPVNYTVSVYENEPAGTPLINVTATDADSGQNAAITYSVTGGDPFSVFTVITKVGQSTVTVRNWPKRLWYLQNS